MSEKAECRGCKRELIGKPFYMGGCAYLPGTMRRCPANHFGGYVCSPDCDRRVSLSVEGSMPGHQGQLRPSQHSLYKYWDELT